MVALILVSLASACLREYWFHGSIFAGARDHVQSWVLLSAEYDAARWPVRFRDFVAGLLGCPRCFTFHAGLLAGTPYVLAELTGNPLWMLPNVILSGIYLSLVYETQFGR